MNKKFSIVILFLVFVLFLNSCALFPDIFNDNSQIVGTWKLNKENGEKYTFNSNGKYKYEFYDNNHYYEFENGTFIYIASTNTLTLKVLNRVSGSEILIDISDDNRVRTHTLTLDDSKENLVLDTNSLIGGNTTTLLGSWEGLLQETEDDYINFKFIIKWTFAETTATYSVFLQNEEEIVINRSDTGDISYDIANNQFTISNSTNSYDNGVYNFAVVGKALSINQDPYAPKIYEKQ